MWSDMRKRGEEWEGTLQRRKDDRGEQTADFLILKDWKKCRDGQRTGDPYACWRGDDVDETERQEEEKPAEGWRCDTEGARCVVSHCPPQGLPPSALQSRASLRERAIESCIWKGTGKVLILTSVHFFFFSLSLLLYSTSSVEGFDLPPLCGHIAVQVVLFHHKMHICCFRHWEIWQFVDLCCEWKRLKDAVMQHQRATDWQGLCTGPENWENCSIID